MQSVPLWLLLCLVYVLKLAISRLIVTGNTYASIFCATDSCNASLHCVCLCPSIYLSLCLLPACLPIYPAAVCLSICLSLRLSVHHVVCFTALLFTQLFHCCNCNCCNCCCCCCLCCNCCLILLTSISINCRQSKQRGLCVVPPLVHLSVSPLSGAPFQPLALHHFTTHDVKFGQISSNIVQSISCKFLMSFHLY